MLDQMESMEVKVLNILVVRMLPALLYVSFCCDVIALLDLLSHHVVTKPAINIWLSSTSWNRLLFIIACSMIVTRCKHTTYVGRAGHICFASSHVLLH